LPIQGNPNMDWCCSGFENAYGKWNDRGTHYYLEYIPNGNHKFLLVTIAVDPKNFKYLNENPIPIPISLVTIMRINFCPTCGVNLNKFYRWYFNTEEIKNGNVKNYLEGYDALMTFPITTFNPNN
jgi:hypothetical protein